MTDAVGSYVSNSKRLGVFLLRQDTKFTKLRVKALALSSSTSKLSVVKAGGPIVSLTSFSERLKTVHLTIESIATGSLLPSRFILWIQSEEEFVNRPDTIRRLEARGLEVILTKSFGSHSKYYPYLLSQDHFAVPFVTCDDDMLYSKWWLEGLAVAHDQSPSVINCYRAHSMQISDGIIHPYLKWKVQLSTKPSPRCFATGGAGVIYPAKFLSKLKSAGSKFLEVCPKADDVWLHANELRAGFEVRQVGRRPLDFPSIPGTQVRALFHTNWNSDGNDEQIRKTYTPADIAQLTAVERAEAQSSVTFAH